MAFEKDQARAMEKARRVKLFAHDVHGVLTPNTLYCDVEGRKRFGFWHVDGFGDLSLKMNGIQVIFLDSTSVGDEGFFRAKELKMDKTYFKVKDKAARLDELRREHDLDAADTAYIGCEITDLAVMQAAGFTAATADAVDEVKAAADWITKAPGGRGPIREICEFILRAQGSWDDWVVKVTQMGYK